MGLIIYSGIVLLLLAGSVRKPSFALGAFLCMFGLEQWGAAKIGFVASNGSFTNYLAATIVIIALGVKVLRGRSFRLVTGPVQLLSVALYAYAIVTLLWTPAYDVAVTEWRGQAPYLLISVLVLPLLVQDVEEAAEGIHATLIAGGILCACLAFFVNWGYRSIESEVSGSGDIQLPLAIAQLGAFVFVLAVIYMPWRGLYAVLTLALIAVSVLLVIKTGSRGQLVAMMASAFLFLPLARGWSMSRGYIAALVLVAVVAGGIWMMPPDLAGILPADQDTRFDTDRAVVDYSERIENARHLFDLYTSSSILELLFGLGNSASFSPAILGYYPHIVPIEILCELGIVGFSIFLIIVILTIRVVVRFISNAAELRGDTASRRVVASLCALAVIEFLLAFKEGSLVRDVNLLLFPILIEGVVASLLAKRRPASEQPSPQRERPRLLEGDGVRIPGPTKMEIRHGR